MQVENDLAVVRDVRRHLKLDSRFLEPYGRLRELGLQATFLDLLRTAGRVVDHADRSPLTNQDTRRLVVHGLYRRCGNDVRQIHPLQHIHEVEQPKVTDGDRGEQLQRRGRDSVSGIRQRRHRRSPERNLRRGRQRFDDHVGHAVEVRVHDLPFCRVERRTREGLIELIPRGVLQVPADPHLLDIAAIDEDDLGGDRHLRGPHVEVLDQLCGDLDVLLEIRDDDRVRRLIGDHLATLRYRRL